MSAYGPTLKISQQIHQEKYRVPGESFEDSMNRVARALSDNSTHEHYLKDILLNQRFLPAGRIQTGAGTNKSVTLYNCFVSGDIHDNFTGPNGIMERATQAAETMRRGGGVGYNFGSLRPRNDTINSLGSPASGPVSFMHIYDAVCKTVSSAGHRRGAQMGVLPVSHPDIEEFIEAKQNDHSLTAFNISIGISDRFIDCLNTGNPFTLEFGGKQYKTIDPKVLWEKIMRSTWDYAEPGVIFLDQINRMNNLWYCENISATNPCLVKGTLVQTPQGLVPVETIKEGDIISTILGSGAVKTVEITKNVKQVFKVTTTDGSCLYATPGHIFHVIKDKYINTDTRLDELRVGDLIRCYPGQIPNNQIDNPFPNMSTREYGLFIGMILGDGSFTHKTKNLKICSSVDDVEWNEVIKTLLYKAGATSVWEDLATDGSKSKSICCSRVVCKALDATPLVRAYSYEKDIPLEFLNSNKEFLQGLFDGLISTDGNVNMNKKNPCIRFATSSFKLATGFKRLCSFFGIHCKIYKNKPSSHTLKDTGRVISSKHTSYTCIILGSNLRKVYDEFTLSNPAKQARVKTLVTNYVLSGEMWATRIKSIEPIAGDFEVYDLFEPVSDTWITEGIVNRGCSEQPLPAHGACLLGSFNLVKYITRDLETGGYAFHWARYINDITHVVRAMDNVVDISMYPLSEQESEAISKRRMGLGITGFANTSEILGHSYGSEKSLRFLEGVLKTLRDISYSISVTLAQQKGAFPLFDKEKYLQSKFVQTLPIELQEEIYKYGIRNSHLLSIAPTGTISIAADNISSGIEPVFSVGYMRKLNLPGGQIEEFFSDYAYRNFKVIPKTADQLTANEHLNVLTVAQKYVDSAVSKTCNVNPNMPWDEFKQLYLNAWKSGCKGLSTFNVGGKRAGILTTVKEEKKNEVVDDEQEGLACYIDPLTGNKSCG